MKGSFPKTAHRKHLVGGVTMVEKSLKENGDEPVSGKKQEYSHVEILRTTTLR
jgi:hypothetical protein